jgi:hypothetical protein
MPTPDSSQFIQKKRLQAIERRVPTKYDKVNTHLYQFTPSASALTDFLPSFTNKITSSIPRYRPINIVTGLEAKPKVPGGRS